MYLKRITLVIDDTLASDNHLRFRKNILKRRSKLILQLIIRLEMKNYNMNLIEKRQKHHHYQLEKIDKYKYYAGEEI